MAKDSSTRIQASRIQNPGRFRRFNIIQISTGGLDSGTNFHVFSHSRPQSPRSFWPAAEIESSGRTRFSEHAQSISFVLSTNQICQIWREVRESRTSGVGPSQSNIAAKRTAHWGQSSRSLPRARRVMGSGDENFPTGVSTPAVAICWPLYCHEEKAFTIKFFSFLQFDA